MLSSGSDDVGLLDSKFNFHKLHNFTTPSDKDEWIDETVEEGNCRGGGIENQLFCHIYWLIRRFIQHVQGKDAVNGVTQTEHCSQL